MVTLTTRRRLDEIQLSKEVSDTLHRVNTALFGTHYSRRKTIRLSTLAVQERSIEQGLHTHILVGVPEGSLELKANPALVPVPDLIIRTWVSLDDRFMRSPNAQDARRLYDFDGARGYVMKTMTSYEALNRVDWLNTTSSDV